jgi:hypothetical protein
MHEAAKMFVEFKDCIQLALIYLLEIFQRFKNLQTLTLNTIFEISLYCKNQMSEGDFNLLYNFMS